MAVIWSDLCCTSKLRSHAQMTPSRPPEYLFEISVSGRTRESASGYVQDRVVAIYGKAVHAEAVATSRVCERQHIADPLARLTSHVRCSGMYKDCPEIMSRSNAPIPNGLQCAKTSVWLPRDRRLRRELGPLACVESVPEARRPVNGRNGKHCTKYSNALDDRTRRTRSQSPPSL